MGGCLALPLGGDEDDEAAEQDALLLALSAGLDPTGPEQLALTFAEGIAVAMVWAIDTRLTGILDPNRMIEVLPAWEQACGLRPALAATDLDRRNALAAKFFGIVGNTVSYLYAI